MLFKGLGQEKVVNLKTIKFSNSDMLKFKEGRHLQEYSEMLTFPVSNYSDIYWWLEATHKLGAYGKLLQKESFTGNFGMCFFIVKNLIFSKNG